MTKGRQAGSLEKEVHPYRKKPITQCLPELSRPLLPGLQTFLEHVPLVALNSLLISATTSRCLGVNRNVVCGLTPILCRRRLASSVNLHCRSCPHHLRLVG